MLGKVLYGFIIASAIVGIVLSAFFVFAQPPSFEVNWYHVEQGISHQAYNISIKNPSSVVSKNFDMSVVFSNANFDLSKIKNVRISTWQNLPHQVPVSESYQEAATCQDANNNTYACQQTKYRTVHQTQYWYEWASPTSLALNNGKKNYGITNLAANKVEWYRLEFDLPVIKNGKGWGSSGKLALFDEIDKAEYHPPFDVNFTKRQKITVEKLPITTTNYQVLLNVTYDSDMQPNFDDLRFRYLNETSGNETSDLSYYIWHKVNSNYADVFVNVPIINSTHDATLYMYYSNATPVSTTSNGENTFDFFDDFSGGSLDTSKWLMVAGSSSTCVITPNGFLNATNPCRLQSATIGLTYNYSLYFNGSIPDIQFSGFGMINNMAFFNQVADMSSTIYGGSLQDNVQAVGVNGGSSSSIATGQPFNKYFEGKIVRYQPQLRHYTNFSSFTTPTQQPIATINVSVFADSAGANNVSIDYFFVTKSIQPEPNASFFTEESVVNQPPTHSTPIFNSTFGKNFNAEDLTCYNQNTFDADGDTVTNIFSFYKNSVSLSALNMPFESNYTLTKTADYSGHQNNATISGATFAAGKVGRALQFDGVDDYVNLFKPSSLTSLSTALTIEAWVYSNDNTGQRLIFDNCESFATEGYCLYINDNEFRFTVGKAGAPTASAVGISSGWHHVVGTYDNTNAKIYVDGILKNTTAATGPLAQAGDEDIIIGKNSAGGDQFNGIIDEVQVYPTSLSSAQVSAHNNLQTNKIVEQETSGGDNFICSVTPNDAKVDGSPLNSSSLTILWNVTFNVTYTEDNSQLDAFNMYCTNGPTRTNVNSPFSEGFQPGTYSCNFNKSALYFEETVTVPADNDKLIDVKIDKQNQLTIAEHNWLESLYNCWIVGNCTAYNLLANVTATTAKVWNQFKRTDQSIVTKEQFLSLVVNSTSNLTINYTVNIPTKEGFGVVQGLQGYDDFLPIRISYWFLDPTNTTCYNQGTKPTGVENPYCQPLTIQTVGRINTAIDFKVDLRPTLPTGTYTIVRSIEIDPLGQWIDYGQEIIGAVEVKETNNNILAKVSVPASYVAEAMKEVGGIAGPTGLFLWKFVNVELLAIIMTLTTIGLLGYIIGLRHGFARYMQNYFYKFYNNLRIILHKSVPHLVLG